MTLDEALKVTNRRVNALDNVRGAAGMYTNDDEETDVQIDVLRSPFLVSKTPSPTSCESWTNWNVKTSCGELPLFPTSIFSGNSSIPSLFVVELRSYSPTRSKKTRESWPSEQLLVRLSILFHLRFHFFFKSNYFISISAEAAGGDSTSAAPGSAPSSARNPFDQDDPFADIVSSDRDILAQFEPAADADVVF